MSAVPQRRSPRLLVPFFEVQVERREIGDLQRLCPFSPSILVTRVNGRFLIAAGVHVVAAAQVLGAIRIDSYTLSDRRGEVLRHSNEFSAHVLELVDEAPTPLGET
jgi:hypothetical protein